MKMRLFPVSAVFIHRHGERTPILNLYKNDALKAKTMSDHWKSLLVEPRTKALLDRLYRIEKGNLKNPDEISAPFGCLTSKGFEQMKDLGKKIKYRLKIEDTNEAIVKVYSTPYQRTQLSAQALLHGIFGEKGGVTVNVNHPNSKILNCFETRSEEMLELVKQVISKKEFQDEEKVIGNPIKEKLLKSGFDNIFNDRKEFTWMHAADFFWTLDISNVKVKPDLEILHQPTVDYICKRFNKYFSHPKLLSVMTAGLFESILKHFKSSTDDLEKISKLSAKQVMILSGHDVTILSILHALKSNLAHQPGYWPSLGSWIMFELLVDDNDKKYIKIEIDGHPISSSLIANDGIISLSNFENIVQPIISDGMKKVNVLHKIDNEKNPGLLR